MSYKKRRHFRSKGIILVMFIGILSLVGFRYFDLGPAKVKGLITLAETKLKIFKSMTSLTPTPTAAAIAIATPTSKDNTTNTNTNTNTSFSSSSSASEHIAPKVSYVLLDPQTNQILKSQNPDLQRAPASTLKLLTGLIAEESLKETDIVKVGPEVTVEGSRLGLSPGDEISVDDLLTALYVNSSNDAAAALAVKISGSIPEFAQKMNNYATALGCQNSRFTNPHGMPDPDQYTTASDFAVIANHFIKNEKLMKYVQKNHARVQWKDAQGKIRNAELQNTNLLLGVYPGDRGLKTGTTTEAGQCLVTYVTRADGDLLLVLFGSEQRYKDTINLLDEAWAEQRSKAALRDLSKDPRSLIVSPGLF
ncbi:D-alanyl-D-alanine carboxypeptidase family protein [Desulfosporosinus sp. BICA1-9]|uniref:D-alanyl-D-alanine carboxypeptidase family protein n=1 Tax=Desulfosporosinus sp. BICA1-9 TaxID=1531958 RepID=UPI000A954643|nr:serine hydrolase [Desulfosporosinus sp. BICA1-9]